MMKKIYITLLIVASLFASNATAAIISSSDANDFDLNFETFAFFSSFAGVATSDSGNMTLTTRSGNAFYREWTNQLTGGEYAISDRESFDIGFSQLQTAFAMNYVDNLYDSLFTLSFFNGATNVGSIIFETSAPFDTANFIGFFSTQAFNRVEVRESGVQSEALFNEYFQFYTGVYDVPAPSTLPLFGVILAFFGLSARKRNTI